MRNGLFLPVLFAMILATTSYGQAPSIISQVVIGGYTNELPAAVITLPNDDYVVCGTTNAADTNFAVPFGSQITTTFVVKYSKAGVRLFLQKVTHMWATALVSTGDGGFIVLGHSYDFDPAPACGRPSDIRMTRFDAAGNKLWEKCYGGSGAELSAGIIKTGDGGFIIAGSAGSANGDVSGGHGDKDIWLFKINGAGTIVWQRTFGGTAYDKAVQITGTPDGNFAVTGATESNNGDITGLQGQRNIVIAKFNITDGTTIWSKVINDVGYMEPTSLHANADGTYWMGMFTNDTAGSIHCSDYSLLKLDAAGNILLQKCIEAMPVDYVNLPDGNLVVCCKKEDPESFYTMALLVCINPSNDIVWQKGYGNDEPKGIALFSDGNMVMTAASGFASLDVLEHHSSDIFVNGGRDVWVPILSFKSNRIAGTTFYDFNDNGIPDRSDQFLTHPTIKSTKAAFVNGSQPNEEGYFRWGLDTGTYKTAIYNVGDVTPPYVMVPESYTHTFTTYNNSDSITFRLVPKGYDVSCTIKAVDSAIVKHKTQYRIFFGANNFVPNDSVHIVMYKKTYQYFVSAGVEPVAITADSLVWTFSVAGRGVFTDSFNLVLRYLPESPIYTFVNTSVTIETTNGKDTIRNNNTAAITQLIYGESKGLAALHVKNTSAAVPVIGLVTDYLLTFDYSGSIDTLNGNVRVLKSPLTQFISATPPPSFVSGDTLVWQFNKLFPGVKDSIKIKYKIPESSAVHAGDTIVFYTAITPQLVDTFTVSVSDTLKQRLRGQNVAISNVAIAIAALDTAKANKRVGYNIIYNFNSLLDSTKGQISFIKDSRTAFVSSVPAVAGTSGDTLFWNFKDLRFNNADSIRVNLDIAPVPVVQPGSQLTFTAGIAFNTIDTFILKKNAVLLQSVAGIYIQPDTVTTMLPPPHGVIWSRPLAGSGAQRITGIDSLSNGGFMAVGYSNSKNGDFSSTTLDSNNAFVARFDRGGIKLWQKIFGGNREDVFNSVKATADGGCIIAGTTSSNDGSISNNHGMSDAWIVKLDAAGEVQWKKVFGGSLDDKAAAIKNTADGGYVFVGTAESVNGDVTNHVGGADTTDAWVVKLSAAGDIQWQKCLGNHLFQDGTDIIQKTNGEFIVLGTGQSDTVYTNPFVSGAWLWKLSNTGNVIWKRTYVDSSTYSEALSLADNGDNTYVFTGSSFWLNFNDAPSNGNHGNDDVLVVDVDDNGNKKWEKFFGGSNIDIAFNIQHARGGGSYITGGTGSTNGNVTGNHGNNDAWVIKIKQDGSLEWQKTFGGSGDDGSFAFSQLSDNNFVIGGTTGSTDADMTGYTRADNAMLIKAGAANIITGMVFIDNNNNHVKDGNEKFYNNVVVKSTKQSTDNASAVENGYYRNVADTGTYVTTVVPAAGYYTVFPATATSVFSSYAKTDTINFALLPIAGKNDLRVTLLPVTPARPGFNASYRMQYINAGTTVVNGTTIKLVKDHRVTLVSSSPAWATVTADTIVWNTGTINPLDTGYITLVAGIPAPPVTNIGDTLNFIATANPLVADETPADNTGILNQRAQGSFDPNDKIEVHGGNFVQVLSPNKEYLSYIIRFQNTGNDTAFAVNVTDTLEAKLDWSSFEMIAASHPYTVAINEGNKITWTFNNILLADSNHNEPASHGYIAFRIRPKADVAPGNVINNTASVYFDFNAPVKTNMQVTVVKPPSPQQPVTSAVSSGYCGTAAAQKVKIANIPAAAYQATVTVRLDNTTVLGVLADSTFSFSPSALAAGNHKIDVVFSNATAVRTTTLNFAITAAANPDVNVSANITTVVNLTSPVVLTAVNAAGGGTTPLYTFAKDRTFTNVLQAEGAVNNVSIQPNTLVVGSNWFYVRMKTSDTCFTSQTNIDSIKIERSSVTGLRDMDYPNRLINVYPNPFKQGININGLNTAKSYTISIHTAAGQQVYRQQVSNRATYSIDKLILPGGSYWLTIYDDKKHKAIGTTRLLRE